MSETGIIISLFSLGLFGGFSHCIGMCGPFVLTQVNNRLQNIKIDEATEFRRLQGVALFPYHLGRATTYSFIGGLSSFFVSNFKEISGFKYLSALMLIIAALIFVNMACFDIKSHLANASRTHQKLAKHKYWYKIKLPFKISLIQNHFLFWLKNNFLIKFSKNKIQKLFLKPYNINGYFLGILLGFIPCGLLYGAIITASSMDNYLLAALAMFCFAMGTIPALFITACGGYLFFSKFETQIKLFTKIILLLNSLTLFTIAIGLIFNKI